MTFAEKLRMLRNKKKLTQYEAAEKAGISRRTYIYYESGEKYPRSRKTVEKLAEIFDADINMLMPEDDDYILNKYSELPLDEKADKLISSIEEVFSDETATADLKQKIFDAVSSLYLQYSGNEKQNVTGEQEPRELL